METGSAVSCGGLFQVEGLGEDGDGVLDGDAGGHLDLPLAGLALAGHEVGGYGGDVVEQGLANGLGDLVVLLLEAVGSGDAAAVAVQLGQFHARNHLQQLGGEDSPAEAFLVAGAVVGGARLPAFLPDGLDLTGDNRLVQELLHEADVILYVGVVNFQKLRIFLNQGKGAGGGYCNDIPALLDGFTEDVHVDGCVAGNGGDHAVCYLGNAAAALPFHDMYTISEGVHNRHEILAQLGIIEVGIAAVKIADMLLECILSRGSVLLVPVHESLGGVFRQGAVLVHANGRMHDALDGSETQREVCDGGEGARKRTYLVRTGEHHVAELGSLAAIVYAGLLDKVCDAHARRARDLAALAVEAVFQGIVEEDSVLEPVSLAIGAGTLGAAVCGVVCHDGAHRLTERALLALLEVLGAYVSLLHDYFLLIALAASSALCTIAAVASPWALLSPARISPAG